MWVTLDSSSTGLSELLAGSNFNPPSTPYNGSSDADVLDSYPAEIHGLVHLIGAAATIEIGQGLKLNGVLLCDGSIVIGDSVLQSLVNSTITVDSHLFTEPPEGYTTGAQMAPVAGTWERQPSP